MTAYQGGIANFEGMETQVFGVSTDNWPSQAAFAKQVGATFPMLSDFAKREVSKAYGVLVPERGTASRATFVVDLEGKIAYVEHDNSAVDISGAQTACSRLKKKQ